MRLLQLFFSLLLFASLAAQAGEKEIRQSLQKNLSGMEITSLSKTPYGGLYELVVDGQAAYVTSDGKYLFLGNVIELQSKRNLTAARNAKLMEVKWDTLPLANAIKEVKGNGSRKLAIFSDADCPYCRKLEPELEKLTNVTIYTFLYPIEGLHPNAVPTSKKIWCEKDRLKAWKAYMLKGEEPKSAGDCANPVDENVALGAKLRVSGTPTMVLENGTRIPGYVSAEKLEQMLTSASRR